jgi:short-subunit dehydrogenase
MNHQGKLALITGGSEGIGLATAKRLVKEGASVVILSRNQDKLEAAAKQIFNETNQKVSTLAADVASDDGMQRAMHDFVQKWGAPDYLINCAGYAHPGYLEDLSLSAYRGMMDVNFFGVVNACKGLVPAILKSKKKTHIVNTSSLAGFMGLFGYTGYCASKYAVVGFSEALRAELKPAGIKISVLCPPNTKTPGLDKENKIKPIEVLEVEEKAKVVSADDVAKVLVGSLGKDSFWLIPTLDGNLAHYLSRFLPGLLQQIIKRPKK